MPLMAKKSANSEAVTKSRASTGAKSVSVYLLPEERALWDKLAKQRGQSKKAVFMDGLKALATDQKWSDDALLAELKKRLKGRK